jgi:signal transduction histidine kinase
MRDRDARQAERQAAELEAVLDAIADGLVVFGPGGEVRSMNEAALRLVAGDASAPVPAAGPAFVDADDAPLPPERHPVGRALAGEAVRGQHLRMFDPATGRRARLVASAAPIRGPGGTIAGAVLTFSDETSVHLLQEQRDDLLRAITHDLRTPLNAIYLHAHHVVQGTGGAERAPERGRSIARSCERLSAMIQDLSDSAQLEAGRMHLAPQPVDVAALVGDLLDRLQGGLDVERVRFSAPADLPPAMVDPRQLERILVNLVSNALKYSPVQTEVEVRAAPVEGGVEIAVVDRGVGITPEDQVHLFDRWFRARGTRRPEGLGLGLYITRLLVEAQGGRVHVASAPGQGADFRVVFPAAPRGDAPNPAEVR